jgi:hypothetical protein
MVPLNMTHDRPKSFTMSSFGCSLVGSLSALDSRQAALPTGLGHDTLRQPVMPADLLCLSTTGPRTPVVLGHNKALRTSAR